MYSSSLSSLSTGHNWNIWQRDVALGKHPTHRYLSSIQTPFYAFPVQYHNYCHQSSLYPLVLVVLFCCCLVQICQCQDSNSGGIDLWSNTLTTKPRRCPCNWMRSLPYVAYDFSGVAWVLVALCGSQIGHPLPYRNRPSTTANTCILYTKDLPMAMGGQHD